MDLDIALRKLHELSAGDGDLGHEYWTSVARLLKDAEHLRARVEELRLLVDRLQRQKIYQRFRPLKPAQQSSLAGQSVGAARRRFRSRAMGHAG